MNRIVPHLWFDREAKEAAAFYTSLFPNSRVIASQMIKNTPSGDVEAVDFELDGQVFGAISAGPEFHLNPSVSFLVHCASAAEVNTYWNALADGGTALMPLDEYPFCKRFGWIRDRFGVTWQLMLQEGEQPKPRIAPYLLFSGQAKGKAADAVRYYTEVFQASGLQEAKDTSFVPPSSEGTSLLDFKLLGQRFFAMDHGFDADFTFNEAISLIVYCDTQAEIDYFTSKLSHVPQSEECGWVKDKFGVSWQIVPVLMNELMVKGSQEQVDRMTQAILQMKKLDIAAIEKAFNG